MIALGRHMFAVAFIAFGVLQLTYGDFVAGRPPAWPEALYGGWIWAYASGACFVVAGPLPRISATSGPPSSKRSRLPGSR
jgi:hypothetical protein